MDEESPSLTPERRARRARFFFVIGTLMMFSGLLATSNVFAVRRPMDPAIGIGEALVGGLLACVACRLRRDFVWLLKTLIFQAAVLVTLFGAVRVLRLAFGSPWSIVSNQALLPLALTVLGSLGVYCAYRLFHAGEGIHPMF